MGRNRKGEGGGMKDGGRVAKRTEREGWKRRDKKKEGRGQKYLMRRYRKEEEDKRVDESGE